MTETINAILLGPGPLSGQVLEVDARHKVDPLRVPELGAPSLFDYRLDAAQQSGPIRAETTHVVRVWQWDHTVNERGQYRFRTA